jgi:dolichol-phosphate mannosyltransferase
MIKLFNDNNHSQEKDNHVIYLSLLILTSLIIHLACMSQANLLVEEAYYWNYSQHMDWSYLDHPPMVAVLIKIFTSLLGTNEFSVRSASLFCWGISAFFAYQLSELIHPQSGRYALLLLAILPFFFFQSIVITPDVPLLACWSACLYFIYKALILNQGKGWYWAGLSLGLGMLSKYTICLVGLAALCYVLSNPQKRFWLTRKEPYIGALISLLLFTPVIYWNYQHGWISFIFQSSRRFNSTTPIDIHNLLWVVLFYITPLGGLELWTLARKSPTPSLQRSKAFVRYFTFIPLGFFTLYSLNHEVNFNWPGPLFLAFVPWLSALITNQQRKKNSWLSMTLCLLIIYSAVLLLVNYNQSERIQQKLLVKVIAWDDLINKLNLVAAKNEYHTQLPIIFVPLDKYPIGSELAFYQTKLFNAGLIAKKYPVIGAHIFNRESLMYRYWSKKNENLEGALLILLSKEAWRFEDPEVTQRVIERSKLKKVWSIGQGQHLRNIPYYYKIVQWNG